MSVNIYVGNLSYDATEKQLEELFGAHGKVLSAKIITDPNSGRSKGFGFIEMENKDEADKAIAELNGKNLVNRNLKVNLAKPKNNTRRDHR